MKRLFNSDFIIVSLNNNGSAFIETEHASWETSFQDASVLASYAKQNGYTQKSYVRHSNNDVTIILN